MNTKKLGRIAGISYLIIFFLAIFANFLALETIKNAPLETVSTQGMLVRLGILAFLITVVFDVVVAWALYLLYHSHPLTGLSTLFRMLHAVIMGVAVFSLPMILSMTDAAAILRQVETFDTIWLIGLFFFGIHLVLLGIIINRPRLITLFLILAGIMYMADTTAHFLLPNYGEYGEIFLMLVAIPSILGEMSLAIWLLFKGPKPSL